MEKAHGVLLLLIFTLFAGSAVWLKLALSGGDGSGHAIKTPAWLSPPTPLALALEVDAASCVFDTACGADSAEVEVRATLDGGNDFDAEALCRLRHDPAHRVLARVWTNDKVERT